MTFIVAWKSKDAVFITGDSALTRTGFNLEYLNNTIKETKWKTTFDENIVLNHERIVQEAVVKIHNIQNKLIIGYAGAGNSAIDVIAHIEQNVNPVLTNLQELIAEGASMYGGEFQMVVGYFNKSTPCMLTFNLNDDSEFEVSNTWATLGSGRNNESLRLISINAIEFLENLSIYNSHQDRLVQFCTLIQSLILRDQLLETGVGGFFTGGYLTKRKFTWQKDTAYVTFLLGEETKWNHHSPNVRFTNGRFLFLFHRANKVAILSMHEETGYRVLDVFFPHINSFDLRLNRNRYIEDYNIWIKKYEAEIKNKIKRFNSKYFVFLSYDKRTSNKMTFIQNYLCSSKYIFDVYWSNGVPTLNVTKEFVEEIDPNTAKFDNELLWFTKKNPLWYVNHLFKYCVRKIWFSIKKPNIKE